METDSHIRVAPDSVRVWRGFMAEPYRRGPDGRAKFRQSLRELFIPLTAQAMAPLGLTAYQPTILSDDDCARLPDEIALVFYESQQAYKIAGRTTLGKAYGMLHGNVFNFSREDPTVPWSTSAFPVRLDTELLLDKPYYLFDDEVDWYHDDTRLYVGVWRRPGDAAAVERLREACLAMRENRPTGLDGLILVAAEHYLLVWTHGADLSADGSLQPPGIEEDLRCVVSRLCRPLAVAASMLDPLRELEIDANDPVTIRFERRGR